MIVVAMRDRADESIQVGDLGETWQVLADVDSGHVRGDRMELTADFFRRVGFQIPGFEVRRPAIIKDQDAGLRLAESAAGGSCLSGAAQGARAQPIGPQQSGEAQTSNAEQLTPVKAVAKSNAAATNRKHSVLPLALVPRIHRFGFAGEREPMNPSICFPACLRQQNRGHPPRALMLGFPRLASLAGADWGLVSFP